MAITPLSPRSPAVRRRKRNRGSNDLEYKENITPPPRAERVMRNRTKEQSIPITPGDSATWNQSRQNTPLPGHLDSVESSSDVLQKVTFYGEEITVPVKTPNDWAPEIRAMIESTPLSPGMDDRLEDVAIAPNTPSVMTKKKVSVQPETPFSIEKDKGKVETAVPVIRRTRRSKRILSDDEEEAEFTEDDCGTTKRDHNVLERETPQQTTGKKTFFIPNF